MLNQEMKEYVLGLKKIDKRTYLRDIIIKIPKKDFYLKAEYVGLDDRIADVSVLDDKDKEHYVRGLHDFLRGSIYFDRTTQIKSVEEFDFIEVEKEKQKFDIGLSQKAKENAFAYKQAINILDDYEYFIMRMHFKSDNKKIRIYTTHIRKASNGHDGILNFGKIEEDLSTQIKKIVEDTLFLYSLYFRVVNSLDDSDYNYYFKLYLSDKNEDNTYVN